MAFKTSSTFLVPSIPDAKKFAHPVCVPEPSLTPSGGSTQESDNITIDCPQPIAVDEGKYFVEQETFMKFRRAPTRKRNPQAHKHLPSYHVAGYSDSTQAKKFPRISKPVELMKNSYDFVVIGSGYGGSVAASRLARSLQQNRRQSVCVLERGKERWPGEYPESVSDGLKNLHITGELSSAGLPRVSVDTGDPSGMFHLVLGKGLSAVVGNGLGGTSLMNANVFLRADGDTLSMAAWPREIRGQKGCLEKYYEKVEKVLQPSPYPDDWPELPKVELLRKQAELIGMKDKFYKVPQTTRFHNGTNSCGVEMTASTLTGQDSTGLNDGSKNTTLVTYLADAWNWGAEMFCECEVRYIKKSSGLEGGYIVYFAWRGRKRSDFKDDFHDNLMWVHAKKCVFLGAGSLGSTEILLRSKEKGLTMSDRVGQNMSGNGDMLAFGYNTQFKANAFAKRTAEPYDPVGPTINSIIDNRQGHANPLDGWVIEEGSVPRALAPLMKILLDVSPAKVQPQNQRFSERVRSKMRRYGRWLFGPLMKNNSISNTQIYLVMSHDTNQASLSLKNDKPLLQYVGVERSSHVEELNKVLAEMTQAVGGTLVHNPFYALLGKQQATVHPIGGACMASDGTGVTGVTDHAGALFIGPGIETYEGIVVLDGSVVPTALGVNPLATIAALAERSVDILAKKHRLRINETPNGRLNLFGEPEHPFFEGQGDQKTSAQKENLGQAQSKIQTAEENKASGVGFTEMLSGYIHYDRDGISGEDTIESHYHAHQSAKSLYERCKCFLSVQSFDTRQLVRHSSHSAFLTGTVSCPSLPGSPFMVHQGQWNVFVTDSRLSTAQKLVYDFDMWGTDRQLLHFYGYKIVDSSVAFSPSRFWKATSSLFVTITKPDPHRIRNMNDPDDWRRDAVIAKGVIRVRLRDFCRQLQTLSSIGGGRVRRTMSTAMFMAFFVRKGFRLFLGPLAPLQYPSVHCTGYINNTPPDASWIVKARDGVPTHLHMWNPTNPRIAARNLFMIPGAAVDHHIFALPTIPYNAVNYFTRAGYRVFVSVHRIGQLIVAQNHWTTYDARLDLLACLEKIREEYSEDGVQGRVYTVAHCMGSVALATGLLSGDIPSDWLLGLTCSQVFMNPIWNTSNMTKVRLKPSLDKTYKAVAGSWFPCAARKKGSVVQRVIDQALRFYPDKRHERCSNASCHRCSLVFGRCWSHRNLNEATHRQIDRFFGGVNMDLLGLLMKQGAVGHVMTNGPEYTVLDTPENIERLRGVPMFLFVGQDSDVLSPAATENTYDVLCKQFGLAGPNGTAQYRRRVVPGYGHLDCWMGQAAWRDVYPMVREEVDRVVRGETYKFVEPQD